MRFRKFTDADVLDSIAVSYRMHRVLNKEYDLPPLEASIIVLIGSYSNRPSAEIPSLSVPEINSLLAYSKTNRERIYYATKALIEGDEPPLQMHKEKNKAATYSLTAKGSEIVKAALNLAKLFRYECAQIELN